MFFVTFFLVACISTLAASDDYNWVPKTIPTASQQCINAGKYTAVCGNNGSPHNAGICAKMLCAQFMGRDHIGIPIRPMTGTVCGESKVCKNYHCVAVPHNKFPEEHGSRKIEMCQPDLREPIVIKKPANAPTFAENCNRIPVPAC